MCHLLDLRFSLKKRLFFFFFPGSLQILLFLSLAKNNEDLIKIEEREKRKKNSSNKNKNREGSKEFSNCFFSLKQN